MIEVICINTRPYLTGEGLRTHGNLINLTIGQRYQAKLEDGPLEGWGNEQYLLDNFRLPLGRQ